MPRISDGDYNKAKKILEDAGSDTAKKSHKKHGNDDGSPEDHGVQLLREARDELLGIADKTYPKDARKADPKQKRQWEDAYKAAKKATQQAAKVMGVNRW